MFDPEFLQNNFIKKSIHFTTNVLENNFNLNHDSQLKSSWEFKNPTILARNSLKINKTCSHIYKFIFGPKILQNSFLRFMILVAKALETRFLKSTILGQKSSKIHDSWFESPWKVQRGRCLLRIPNTMFEIIL